MGIMRPASQDVSAFRHVGASFATGLIYYSGANFTGLTTTAPSSNTIRAVPFIAPPRQSVVNGIGIYVTTLGALSNARVGIYNTTDSSDIYPKSLLSGSDSAVIDTSGTGLKINTVNVPLNPGQLYWLAHICDLGTATIRGISGAPGSFVVGIDATNGTLLTACFVAQAYGALPGTFPTGASLAGSTTVAPFVTFGA